MILFPLSKEEKWIFGNYLGSSKICEAGIS